jgi:hypothetical protein
VFFYLLCYGRQQQKNRKVCVTQPRHTAIPRHSAVATGDELMDTIALDSAKDNSVFHVDGTIGFMAIY